MNTLYQREIKFRAWDKLNEKMFVPMSIDFENGYVGYHINGTVKLLDIHNNEVVLMQYTGLKDKNGKEICNGDLVVWNEQREPVEVVYREQCIHPFINITTEVIGNIFENPELLDDFGEMEKGNLPMAETMPDDEDK